jgi:hypothetical protein
MPVNCNRQPSDAEHPLPERRETRANSGLLSKTPLIRRDRGISPTRLLPVWRCNAPYRTGQPACGYGAGQVLKALFTA